MKPRLLVLTSTFPRWQDDTDPPFVYNLSKRLTKEFNITVHAPHFPGADTQGTIDDIHVHRFRYFITPFEKLAGSTGILPTLRHNRLYFAVVPFFLIAQFFSMLLLVRKIRPDVIHAHWLVPQGFFGVLMKILFQVPVVVTAHGADVFGLQQALFTSMKQFAGTRADAVTVVSKALFNALTDIFPPEIQPEIISMGVDAGKFNPDKKNANLKRQYRIDGPFLLFVGRLTTKKGVSFLIDALPAVLNNVPHTKLLIVGSGELSGELQAQVNSLGLNKAVLFVGSVPNTDLPAYYATADIFIGPSIQAEGGDREGFGLTLVEAAMSGCLVIGTRTGGIEDIIQDHETGLLVPEKNVEALADTIIYALGHEKEMEAIKKAGRSRCVEKYDWQVIANRYKNLFVKLIN